MWGAHRGVWGAHQGLRDLEPDRREMPRHQDPIGKRRRQCFLPWNTSPAARGQMEVAGRPSGGFHRLGSACSEQALSRRKPALGLREVGVLLPSGMEAVFLQSRTQPAPVPLESRPTPSRRCWVDGVAGPRPLPPPAQHTVCALGGAATLCGRPSPVPPICELIPQGAWAAAGAADPECGRGCSPRRYKTARRRRICMKLGRGPHPNLPWCGAPEACLQNAAPRPPRHPAIRKDAGTPARGRFCSLLVRTPPHSHPPCRACPRGSDSVYSSGKWAPGSTCLGTTGAEGATRGREERYSRGQPRWSA